MSAFYIRHGLHSNICEQLTQYCKELCMQGTKQGETETPANKNIHCCSRKWEIKLDINIDVM